MNDIFFRVNSPHNSKVVQNIILSIGTESYPEDLTSLWQLYITYMYISKCTVLYVHMHVFVLCQVEGCVTNRKSLASRQAITTPVKKKKCLRSRKQKVCHMN